jgi:hypothetical protein
MKRFRVRPRERGFRVRNINQYYRSRALKAARYCALECRLVIILLKSGIGDKYGLPTEKLSTCTDAMFLRKHVSVAGLKVHASAVSRVGTI